MRFRIVFPILPLVITACAEQAVEFGPPPPTAVEIVADTMHGQVVEDPYRWLEDQESQETRAWIDTQNEYTDAIFGQLPDREELTELLTQLMRIDQVGTPSEKGGRYFYGKRRADDELSILYYRDGYDGEDHVLIDPHGMSEDHTTSVGSRDISDDGELMVYAIREGGADQVSLHIRDIETGEDLPDVFPRDRYGSVQLTPDKTGLYYAKYGTGDPRIYYHILGTDVSQDREIFGEGYGLADILYAQLSDDGAWMLVTVLHGSSGWTALYLRNVAADGEWVEIINDGKSRTFGDFAGDKLLLTTNLDADNSRVATADLAVPQVAHWAEFLPEHEEVVIQGASGVGGYYFVSYLQDVQPQLAQYDTDGNLVRRIEFETLGSVYGPSGEWNKSEAFVTFTSFHVPTTTLSGRR